MAKSKTYRSRNVQSVDVKELASRIGDRVVLVGVDVGKGSVHLVVRWQGEDGGTVTERPIVAQQPGQMKGVRALLEGLNVSGKVVVGMEPTGTYGDVLRYACYKSGIKVQRVSPVAAQAYSRALDGVNSQHDGKDAAVVAELMALGKSEGWDYQESTAAESELGYHAELAEHRQQDVNQERGRLEGKLSRHWPEIGGLLELDSVTLLWLVQEYGSPAQAGLDVELGKKLERIGGRFLKEEKIMKIVESCQNTCGLPMNEGEKRCIQELGRRLGAANEQLALHQAGVVEAGAELGMVKQMGAALGRSTMALINRETGDALDYGSAGAYVKALGLNLTEHSSGQQKSGLHISKRGSGRSRQLLYFVALRLVQEPGAVQEWHERKKSRDGGKGTKSLVGVMRKVARGIWRCRRTGEAFDAQKLFAGRVPPASVAAA